MQRILLNKGESIFLKQSIDSTLKVIRVILVLSLICIIYCIFFVSHYSLIPEGICYGFVLRCYSRIKNVYSLPISSVANGKIEIKKCIGGMLFFICFWVLEVYFYAETVLIPFIVLYVLLLLFIIRLYCAIRKEKI